MVRRKERSELELAEIKLHTLLEKRDALNAEAAVFRDERDLLNKKKRELLNDTRSLRNVRSALLDEMRYHKARRDELQRTAKELIELRRKTRSKVHTSVRAELERVRREVRSLEMKQQTSTLRLDEENALLDEIREKVLGLKELEGIRSDQERIDKDVKDIDASIAELFRGADAEHEHVLRLSAEAKVKQDEIGALMGRFGPLEAEADKKHRGYLKIRERADEYHGKAVEMRTRVLSEREAHRSEVREARDLIRRQNLEVRKTLLDEAKLESAAEEALRLLLAKGRVEIKG